MLPKEPLDSTFEASILKQIAESIDLKSNKHLKGLRMHTEKVTYS